MNQDDAGRFASSLGHSASVVGAGDETQPDPQYDNSFTGLQSQLLAMFQQKSREADRLQAWSTFLYVNAIRSASVDIGGFIAFAWPLLSKGMPLNSLIDEWQDAQAIEAQRAATVHESAALEGAPKGGPHAPD